MIRRTYIGSLAIEKPPILASPPVGFIKVEGIEMAVVFPAPLGPNRIKNLAFLDGKGDSIDGIDFAKFFLPDFGLPG